MNIRTAKRIAGGLELPESIDRVEYLRKGYSTDKKYVLWAGDKARYLLRFSDITEEARRKYEFGLLAELDQIGIACPRTVEFGTSKADGVCFSVQEYIAGESAHTVMRKLSRKQQYKVGLEAGRTLRRMHEALAAPEIDWVTIRTEKYLAYKTYCRENRLTFPQQAEIEQLIESNLRLLEDRPTVFLHGDYHPGNMIVNDGRFAGVIDFNRCRWGDPVFEFYKVAQFGAPLSVRFACGQVHGYFNGDAPVDFWPVYNLYVAMVLDADLAWTSRNYPGVLYRSYPLIEKIIRTHDLTGGRAPEWYCSSQDQ